MELAVHLPVMEFGSEGLSLGRIGGAVDAARECGFAAVSANDHFLFQAPWLDGPGDRDRTIWRHGVGDNGRACRAARPRAVGEDARRARCPVRWTCCRGG